MAKHGLQSDLLIYSYSKCFRCSSGDRAGGGLLFGFMLAPCTRTLNPGGRTSVMTVKGKETVSRFPGGDDLCWEKNHADALVSSHLLLVPPVKTRLSPHPVNWSSDSSMVTLWDVASFFALILACTGPPILIYFYCCLKAKAAQNYQRITVDNAFPENWPNGIPSPDENDEDVKPPERNECRIARESPMKIESG